MAPTYGETLEFLNSQLGQRGPNAVPYEETVKYNIREHISDLLKSFPNLVLRVDDFHYNDGRIQNLLKLDGTIPIHHQGKKYNIPVLVWLLDKYPMTPPLMFVNPTPDMIVKQGHSCVDSNGQVRSPVMLNWVFPASTLLDVVSEAAILWGTEPPLYAKPAGYVPPPAPAATTYSNPLIQGPSPSAYPGQQVDPAVAAAYGYNPYNPQMNGGGLVYPAHPVIPAPMPGNDRAHTIDALERVFRDIAIKALTHRVQAGVDTYFKVAVQEVDKLGEQQSKLLMHQRELQLLLKSLQLEREECEQLVKELASKAQALKIWLDENEAKKNQVGDFDIKRVVVPADPLSRQALEAQAEDLAYEDELDVLDMALDRGTIKFDAWFKQVRNTSRKQFYSRALCLKIATKQHGEATAPPPPPHQPGSSRPGQTHGDRLRPYPAVVPPPPPPDSWAMLRNPLATS